MFWIHVTEFFTHIADAPYYVQLIGVAVSVVLLLGGHTGTRRGTLLFLADCFGVAAVTLVLNVAFFLLGIFLHIQVGSYMHFLLAIVLYALLRSRFNPPARVVMACVAFSTVTLLAPESLAGISARTYEGRAEIEYEDVAVETLLPSVSGFVPVDALSGVIDDLCGSVPADYCAEELEGTSCIALTFETSTEEYAGQKRVWLDSQSLAVLRAEFYLDGQMVMSMSVRDFAFAGQAPDAQGQNS